MARDLELSTLCLACGMCCDGTLFTQVPLVGEEPARLRERGLPVILREDGSPALRQRCAALAERCCTVYEARPGGCRRYACMLHAALAADEVGLEEALGIVARAQGLLAALEATLPAGEAATLQRARLALRDGEEEAVREAFAAARRHLARHFQRDV